MPTIWLAMAQALQGVNDLIWFVQNKAKLETHMETKVAMLGLESI